MILVQNDNVSVHSVKRKSNIAFLVGLAIRIRDQES